MKAKVTYWRESDGKYLGYLNDCPDLQGETRAPSLKSCVC